MVTMKKTAAIIALFASVLCISCNQEIDSPDVNTDPEKSVRLTATISDAETKTVLGNDNYILWQEGDQIATVSNVASTTEMHSYTLSSGAGTTEGIFTGSSEIPLFYPSLALYPVPDQNSIDFDSENRQIAAVWKKEGIQCEQTATPGSFDPTANLMVGTVKKAENGGMKAVFKNICSYVKLTIDFSCKSIEFRANEGNKIIAAEKVLMLCDENGTPVKIEGISSSSSFVWGSVTLVGKDGADIAPGTYLIAVLPNTLDFGFTLYFNIDGKSYFKTTQKEAVLKRSGILNSGSFSKSSLSFDGFNGSGTESDPYQISSAEDLQKLSKYVNNSLSATQYADKCYVQTADINCGGEYLPPIGYYDSNGFNREFNGKYDGQGHTISNYVQGRHADCCALFGLLHNASISSLTLNPNKFDTGIDNVRYIGGIAGVAQAGTVIKDCHLTGNAGEFECIVFNDNIPTCLGGIAGVVYGGASGGIEITGCTNSVDLFAAYRNYGYNLNADMHIGGIIGSALYSNNEYTLKIDRCRNYADISSSGNSLSHNGGIAGSIYENFDSTGAINFYITNCVNTGSVSGLLNFEMTNLHLGGIAGYVNIHSSDTHPRYIVNCLNTGSVIVLDGSLHGDYTLTFGGGICGDAGDYSNQSSNLYACASTGTVRTQNCDCYGAISGAYGNFHYCHWTQTVIPIVPAEDSHTEEYCSQMNVISSAYMNNEAVKPSLTGCTYASWTGTSSDGTLDIITSGASSN